MSAIEMIFLILMITMFACNILSFMMLLTLSREIDKIDIHVDFIRNDLIRHDLSEIIEEGDQL